MPCALTIKYVPHAHRYFCMTYSTIHVILHGYSAWYCLCNRCIHAECQRPIMGLIFLIRTDNEKKQILAYSKSIAFIRLLQFNTDKRFILTTVALNCDRHSPWAQTHLGSNPQLLEHEEHISLSRDSRSTPLISWNLSLHEVTIKKQKQYIWRWSLLRQRQQ